MSSLLVQETDKTKQLVYFVGKVFKGTETRYQKIELLSLAVVITARNLIPYFHGHRVMLKTNYPIRQVLKKLHLTGRMVSWAIKQSHYDILYIPIESIMSQVLHIFLQNLARQ